VHNKFQLLPRGYTRNPAAWTVSRSALMPTQTESPHPAWFHSAAPGNCVCVCVCVCAGSDFNEQAHTNSARLGKDCWLHACVMFPMRIGNQHLLATLKMRK